MSRRAPVVAGEQVALIGRHPWAGHVGEVIYRHPMSGHVTVRLDNGHETVASPRQYQRLVKATP